jgi:hypothetical protein
MLTKESLLTSLHAFRSRNPATDVSRVELYIKTGLLASASKLMTQLSRRKK